MQLLEPNNNRCGCDQLPLSSASEGMKSSSLKHLGLFSSPFLVSLRAALEGVTVQLKETINGLIAAWVVRMLRPRLALNGINTA